MMKSGQSADTVTQQTDLCRRLREDIILGRLNHGQRITEKFISERMGVKRGPARESLLILEGQGLIRKVPSLGYFVESQTPEEIRDAYDVRTALETLAVKRAAQNASREHILRLELICEEERAAIADGNVAARVRADMEFHEEIVRASGSRVLGRTYASVGRPFYGKTELGVAKRSKVAAQHTAITKAIRAHDPEAAAALLAEHIEEHEEEIPADCRLPETDR